ncbi:MAG: general secretion pathway protein GspL [Rickettsiales bacterium]|nr:general secretion pathway protein GspL [Rickettsiales bacterium]
MKERLFIRFTSDEKSLQWGILLASSEKQASFEQEGELLLEDVETLAEVITEQQIVLMIPAHRVKCFNVQAPTKNRKHLEKAIPYQLEEQVLDSVDSQHFALGAFDEQDRLAVNVIDKNYFSELVALLKDAGIEPDYVVSEAACLPSYKDAWTALVEEQVLVRQEHNNFWSADQGLVEQLLKLELQTDELSVTQAIRIYTTESSQIDLETIPGLATQKDSVDNAFLFLATNFDDKAINLLQQEFASQKKTQRNYGVWKLPAISASILILLGIIFTVSHIIHLNKQLSVVEEQTLAETKKLYPSLPLTTAVIQINNSYRNIGGDSGSSVSFAGLMEQSVTSMDTKSIKFSQIEYIASRGQLSLDVTAESYDVLTKSQRNLEAAGLKVDMRNASENGGVWTARITVGAK